MSTPEVFRTPLLHRVEKDKGGGAKLKKDNMGSKRDRNSEDESDIDSINSEYSIKSSNNKTKRKKTDKKDKTLDDSNIKDVLDGSLTETDREEEKEEGEEDVEESFANAIRDVEKIIRKTKKSTREIKNYTIEQGSLVRNTIRCHAVQADRQLEVAITKIVNIALMFENERLRHSLSMKDTGTQCSPCLLRLGREENKEGSKKTKAKKTRDRQANRDWEAEEGEKDTEGEEGEEGYSVNERGGGNRGKGRNKDSKGGEDSGWEIVGYKNKKKEEKKLVNNKRKDEEESRLGKKNTEGKENNSTTGKAPPKTEAIIVKTTEKRTFADLFKTLKSEAGTKMEGIRMVRKSRGGDLIIEMEKGTKGAELENIVKNTLGEEHKVRRVAPKNFYEIKGIDPTLEREEIREELAKTLNINVDEVEMKTIRYGYGDTKIAIVTLPTKAEEIIKNEWKIKLGFTNCSIRKTQKLIRCFKCHDFGHLSYNCRLELNGKELCRRCGVTGHQINGCQAIRCCILCTRKGILAANAEHIAGAANCPQYKKYIQSQLEGKPQ